MGGGYKARSGDSLAPIVDAITDNSLRVGKVERPSGTSLSSLVKQVKAAIVGITAQVNATLATLTSLTVNGPITANASTLSGATLSVSGDVRGNAGRFASAPTTNITAARVAAWLQNSDGTVGTASSSRADKADIQPVELAHLRLILGIGVFHWAYKIELRKRDDPSYEGYIGPSYHVGTNIGTMAEDLHAAGLWEFVVYERRVIYEERDSVRTEIDPETYEVTQVPVKVQVAVGDELVLDDHGQPHPIAVQDVLLQYALIPVVADIDDRVARIEAHLGIGDNS